MFQRKSYSDAQKVLQKGRVHQALSPRCTGDAASFWQDESIAEEECLLQEILKIERHTMIPHKKRDWRAVQGSVWRVQKAIKSFIYI